MRGEPSATEDVEDLVQELCLRLVARADYRGSEVASMRAYLARTMRRLASDEVRRRGTCRRRPHRSLRDPRAIALLRKPLDPEQWTEQREAVRLLARRCRSLTGGRPESRAETLALLSTVVDGLTSSEASRAVGGRVAPGRIDKLVVELRRRCAAEGWTLPRRVQ